MAIFWTQDISQGSVATRLGCGGVFVYTFVTNFLLSLTVTEFLKSVNIWWSYGQELAVLFFDSQCRGIYISKFGKKFPVRGATPTLAPTGVKYSVETSHFCTAHVYAQHTNHEQETSVAISRICDAYNYVT